MYVLTEGKKRKKERKKDIRILDAQKKKEKRTNILTYAPAERKKERKKERKTERQKEKKKERKKERKKYCWILDAQKEKKKRKKIVRICIEIA